MFCCGLKESKIFLISIGIKEDTLGDLVVRAEDVTDTNGNELQLNSSRLLDHLVRIMHLSCQYSKYIFCFPFVISSDAT